MIPIVDEYYRILRPSRPFQDENTQAYEGLARCYGHMANAKLFMFSVIFPTIDATNGKDYSNILIRESEIVEHVNFSSGE